MGSKGLTIRAVEDVKEETGERTVTYGSETSHKPLPADIARTLNDRQTPGVISPTEYRLIAKRDKILADDLRTHPPLLKRIEFLAERAKEYCVLEKTCNLHSKDGEELQSYIRNQAILENLPEEELQKLQTELANVPEVGASLVAGIETYLKSSHSPFSADPDYYPPFIPGPSGLPRVGPGVIHYWEVRGSVPTEGRIVGSESRNNIRVFSGKDRKKNAADAAKAAKELTASTGETYMAEKGLMSFYRDGATRISAWLPYQRAAFGELAGLEAIENNESEGKTDAVSRTKLGVPLATGPFQITLQGVTETHLRVDLDRQKCLVPKLPQPKNPKKPTKAEKKKYAKALAELKYYCEHPDVDERKNPIFSAEGAAEILTNYKNIIMKKDFVPGVVFDETIAKILAVNAYITGPGGVKEVLKEALKRMNAPAGSVTAEALVDYVLTHPDLRTKLYGEYSRAYPARLTVANEVNEAVKWPPENIAEFYHLAQVPIERLPVPKVVVIEVAVGEEKPLPLSALEKIPNTEMATHFREFNPQYDWVKQKSSKEKNRIHLTGKSRFVVFETDAPAVSDWISSNGYADPKNVTIRRLLGVSEAKPPQGKPPVIEKAQPHAGKDKAADPHRKSKSAPRPKGKAHRG